MPRSYNMLKKDGRMKCPLEYSGDPVSWPDIAEWLSDEDGIEYTAHIVKRRFEGLLVEIQRLLMRDSCIREWLRENGYTRLLEHKGYK